MTLIIDLQYFPSIILYKNLYKSSNIVFEQYETYQKMSFRNRCQITGAEGLINLSVPLVKGRDQKTLIREVRISDRQQWQAQHWKTIVSCYSRSPWFEFYRHELEALYQRRFDFLLDWNLSCFEWSLRVLGLSIPVSMTERYEKEYDGENVTDWRGKILPKNREGGPKYRQVFEERIGFISNLSVLDLLFCEGKEAIRYIRSS
jgi:WbqC-like protein family